jgi:hypothetical protein
MNFTHYVEIKYIKILHKAFGVDPNYSDPINVKSAEMVAAGKTDGVVFYLPDHVTIIRNFTSLEAANEWLDFTTAHNENPIHDVAIATYNVKEGVFAYDVAVTDELVVSVTAERRALAESARTAA